MPRAHEIFPRARIRTRARTRTGTCTGALLAALAAAGWLGLTGCEPHERTTDERMQDLVNDHDRDMAAFDSPTRLNGDASDPTQGPNSTYTSGSPGATTSPRGPAGEVLNWRVTVTNYTVQDDTQDTLGVLWKYTDATVRVAGGMAPRDSGLKLGLATGDFRAQLDAQSKSAHSASKSESMLVVMKGHTGVLTVGQTRFVPAFVYEGKMIGGALMKTEAVQSLVVHPETTPEGLVQLRLTPQFSRLEGYNDLVLTDLTTTVLLKPGQSLVIGGTAGAENQVAGSLFSHVRGTQNSKTLIVVRVEGM